MTTAFSLKPYNTFGLEAACQHWESIETFDQLISLCRVALAEQRPMLMLGGGSNIIFAANFDGIVAHIQLKGIEVSETDDAYLLSVAAGENWHQLVEFTLAKGMYGLENLALIPGTVGAAPIQNIGAYGVEFDSVCDWVEYLDRQHLTTHRLPARECQFAYRDSIFKRDLLERVIITRVGLKLPKAWQPNLSYGPLQQFSALNGQEVTAKQIFDTVCAVRQQKLPDPAKLGNAGSFFKNPIIDYAHYQRLIEQYPDIAAYPLTDNSVKIAAAWLIDRAGLKGYQQQGVGVHQQQALVLVNLGQATGKDVCHMMHYIQQVVASKFAIQLEAEPRIIL